MGSGTSPVDPYGDQKSSRKKSAVREKVLPPIAPHGSSAAAAVMRETAIPGPLHTSPSSHTRSHSSQVPYEDLKGSKRERPEQTPSGGRGKARPKGGEAIEMTSFNQPGKGRPKEKKPGLLKRIGRFLGLA